MTFAGWTNGWIDRLYQIYNRGVFDWGRVEAEAEEGAEEKGKEEEEEEEEEDPKNCTVKFVLIL
jgi:hypothetical protein